MGDGVMPKPVVWIGSSKEDCANFVDGAGYFRLWTLSGSNGQKHLGAKPLKGFGNASVLEIVEDYRSGTYRAIYTVRFEEAIYMLHVFQKKATHGIATQHELI